MSGIGPQQTSEAVQRSRVAAAIWPWRTGKEQDRARNASARRKRSLIEAAFALLVGAVLICGFHHQAIGAVVLCVGILVGVTGQLFPSVYDAFTRFGRMPAKAMGIGLSWLLLAPFFYICFGSARFLSMIARKDPLHRRWDPEMKSYWVNREPVSNAERYKRQY